MLTALKPYSVGILKDIIDKCVYSEIPCKYQRLGCEVRMMRKAIPSHEDEDKLHLHMALDKVIAMDAIIIKTR